MLYYSEIGSVKIAMNLEWSVLLGLANIVHRGGSADLS